MGAFREWWPGGGLEEGTLEPEQNGKEILREGQPGMGCWSLTKSGGVAWGGGGIRALRASGCGPQRKQRWQPNLEVLELRHAEGSSQKQSEWWQQRWFMY